MSGISSTSMFMTRLASLKQGQATDAKTTNTKTASADISTKSSEPVTIVVTSLNEKVQDLQKLLDTVEQNITTLATSRDLTDHAVGLLEEAGGITVRARDTLKTNAGYEGNKDRLADLEKKFSDTISKLGLLIDNASVNGVNLLKGETLTTSFDGSDKSQFSTTGLNLDDLDFRPADFSSVESVQDAKIDVMNAVDITTTLRHVISSDLMLMQTRQEFSQETISTLTAGAEAIPVADLGDESANLLALQIRQQLTEADVPLAADSQQHILKQFL